MNTVRFDVPDAAVQAAAEWRHDPEVALTHAAPLLLIAELERLAEKMTWDSDESVIRERIAELQAVIL